ncbi:MAG: hypothetical protein EAZ24_09880 [Burkholderiales bacterium]|nr:MAG: hypothetical protein EAZ24_09880 [Burkholderiales bacterium]TAG81577.1 MAG: hypothetical protein EAZ21_05800 [Betaproteobacteria bacterium]
MTTRRCKSPWRFAAGALWLALGHCRMLRGWLLRELTRTDHIYASNQLAGNPGPFNRVANKKPQDRCGSFEWRSIKLRQIGPDYRR